MGCNVKESDGKISNLSKSNIINYIRDNLEGNMINQHIFNKELNYLFKRCIIENKLEKDDIIDKYCDFIFTLINIKNQEKEERLKLLLNDQMELVEGNYLLFHLSIFETLQGLNDYTNIKIILDENPDIKKKIIENNEFLIDVIKDLAEQGIDFLSVSIEDYNNMSKDEVQFYIKLLSTEPKQGINITEKILNELGTDAINLIDINRSNFKNLINKISKERSNSNDLSLEEFKKCLNFKNVGKEIEKIYNCFKNDYFEFYHYIIIKNTNKIKIEKVGLERKARILGLIAKYDLEILPNAEKLEKIY